MECFIDGDPLLFICEWKRTMPQAMDRLDEIVQSISDSVFAEETRIAVKGTGNFRYSVLSTYKGNRARELERESRLGQLRERLIDVHSAVPAHGQEADDLLAQWAHQAGDGPFVIASIDKDLLTIPGIHFNINRGTIEHIDEDRADYLFTQQLLTGDRVDCIPGLSGIGPAKSAKMLHGSKLGKRMAVVKKEYKDVYGAGWKSELQITCDLIFMRREKGVSYKIE